MNLLSWVCRKKTIIAVCTVFLLLILQCGGAAASSNSPAPLAKSGVLNLTTTNLAANPVPLNGQWRIEWGRLAYPGDKAWGAKAAVYLRVPKVWEGQKIAGKSIPETGYGTYELLVLLPHNVIGKTLALYMPSVASAYSLWIDGHMVAKNGKVGTSKATMKPKDSSRVVTFQATRPRMTLVMQASNFVQRKGGLWAPILLGFSTQIVAMREWHITEAVFIAATLLVMGTYHFVIFGLHRSSKAALYLGLLCLCISVRTLLVGDVFLISLVPSIPWEVAVKFEYLSVTLGFLFCTRLMMSQYPKETIRLVNWVAQVLMGLFSLLVIFTPAIMYTQFMLPMQLVIVSMFIYLVGVSLLAAWRKRPGAGLNTLGIALFFAASLNDTLYYNHVVSTGPMVPFGFFCFLFLQSVNLARRFVHSFHQVDSLSSQLLVINESLEQRVLERTQELARALSDLSDSQMQRKNLLDDIVHELGTPLTSVLGYVKGIMDGVLGSNSQQYLQVVYNKALFMGSVMQDLSELTRLETRQLQFDLRQVELSEWVKRMFAKYRYEVPNHTLVLDMASGLSMGRLAYAEIDVFRLEQVLSNLISNAVKYSPEGTEIALGMNFSSLETREHPRSQIYVADHGPGIPESDSEKIFSRFYRSQQVREGTSGIGLGLAISREIMHIFEGDLTLSTGTAGSTFTMSLPVWMEE